MADVCLAVAVSEAQIEASWRHLGAVGVPAGHEGGATLAALRKLRASGHIADGASVLLLVTSGPTAALWGPR